MHIKEPLVVWHTGFTHITRPLSALRWGYLKCIRVPWAVSTMLSKLPIFGLVLFFVDNMHTSSWRTTTERWVGSKMRWHEEKKCHPWLHTKGRAFLSTPKWVVRAKGSTWDLTKPFSRSLFDTDDPYLTKKKVVPLVVFPPKDNWSVCGFCPLHVFLHFFSFQWSIEPFNNKAKINELARFKCIDIRHVLLSNNRGWLADMKYNA